jgi:putative protease
MEEKQIGKVTHYFTKIGVAIVELTDELNIGDKVHIKGATTDITQKVESIQIEHEQIKKAVKGNVIGLKAKDHTREGDLVFKVVKEAAPAKPAATKKPRGRPKGSTKKKK